jgi:hypothetical protein
MDFNSANLFLEPINGAVNDAIERAAATVAELPRPYLGASIVGHECARRIQFDWWCKPMLAARTREIFDRGHYFEERTRQHLIAAGFKFAPPEALAFTAADDAFRGHADGIIIHGPSSLGAYVIYPLIWEHKALNARSWRSYCWTAGQEAQAAPDWLIDLARRKASTWARAALDYECKTVACA